MKQRASEHEVQSAILEYLERKHIFHWRNNTGAVKRGGRYIRFGVKGAPDIMVIIVGHAIGIEVKKHGEEQSADQKEWQREFVNAGGSYLLAYDLSDVTRIL